MSQNDAAQNYGGGAQPHVGEKISVILSDIKLSLSKIQSPADFFGLQESEAFSIPGSNEFTARLRTNMIHYCGNYIVITGMVAVYYMIGSVFSILLSIMLGYGWVAALRGGLLRNGEATDDTPSGGVDGMEGVVEFGSFQMKKRHLFLGTLSLTTAVFCVMFVLPVLLTSGVLCALHGGARAPAVEAASGGGVEIDGEIDEEAGMGGGDEQQQSDLETASLIAPSSSSMHATKTNPYAQ